MAKSLTAEFSTDLPTAMRVVVGAIANLGYTVKSADQATGLVTFDTGMSMRSWAGQSMSVVMTETAHQTVQLTIGGTRIAHGAQIQVYDWGEAAAIAKKVIQAIEPTLGTSKIISSSSSGCFVATAVYGSSDHPAVLVLRRYRDETLNTSRTGRLLIRIYYKVGPGLAAVVSSVSILSYGCRRLIDRLIAKPGLLESRVDETER